MIKLIWESFCRALIRFWDNRFVRNEQLNWYQLQIEKLERRIFDLQGELIEIVSPQKPPAEEAINEIPIQTRAPIETLFQRRMRLEKESKEEWERQLKEAESKRAAKAQTTEELEQSVGVR